MVRVADYVAKFIREELNVPHVFMLSGGGAMYLNDAMAMRHDIKVICNHHEQAGAMGAVAYAKYNNDFAVVIPTTGCGGTNCITGLLDAWQDNLKVVFISGQVGLNACTHGRFPKLRQIGVQEANIIDIVAPITKYAVMVTDAKYIRRILEEAKFHAETGRQGPVWVDIPMDIQNAQVDPETLEGFVPFVSPPLNVSGQMDILKSYLKDSRRPIIIAGNGVKLANAKEVFRKVVEKYNIPVVFTYLGLDVLPTNHRLAIGRIGIKGDRAGNFAMQNANLVISMGCRLSPSMTGYNGAWFAREAKLVAIDVDHLEHTKGHLKVDRVILADLKEFLPAMAETPVENSLDLEYELWVSQCNYWKVNWDIFKREYDNSNGIDLYYFIRELNKNLKPDSIVIGDAGSAGYVTAQGIEIKDNRRYLMPGAQMEMGFTLPACIGASFRVNKEEVIGITGDGSFQLNLQELQTVKYYNLPIKLFVWNNNGYLSIRNTQDNLFSGRHIGTDNKSGVSFPSLKKLAFAYDLPYTLLDNPETLADDIKYVLSKKGPVIVEVMCNPNQVLSPIVASKKVDGKVSSSPFEDMFPFLDREEFKHEMIVKPL